MPRIHCYVPKHLYARRHELPIGVTISSILNEGFERKLAELDAQKVGPKARKRAS